MLYLANGVKVMADDRLGYSLGQSGDAIAGKPYPTVPPYLLPSESWLPLLQHDQVIARPNLAPDTVF